MAKARLKKSEVVFNELPHTYELNGKRLEGITTILHRMSMFSKMYETEALNALNQNSAWKESGLTINDCIVVDGNKISPIPFDNQIFFCTNEELEELRPLYDKAVFEEMRITANKQNAALRGTAVHNMCEAVDNGEDVSNIAKLPCTKTFVEHCKKLGETEEQAIERLKLALPHAVTYKYMRESVAMNTIATEYLVSDNEFVASCIDLVWQNDEGRFFLADIKCVSKMDETYINYVSWQLSIYKYLFEMQNPSKKVEKILCVWLPQKECYGTAKIIPLQIHDKNEVEELLTCAREGRDYCPIANFELPATITESFSEYLAAKARIKADTEIVKAFETGLLQLFDEHDVKKWDFEGKATFTRTLPGTKQAFDASALKEAEPEVYNKYIKTTQTKSSLRVTIK